MPEYAVHVLCVAVLGQKPYIPLTVMIGKVSLSKRKGTKGTIQGYAALLDMPCREAPLPPGAHRMPAHNLLLEDAHLHLRFSQRI